MQIKLHRAFNSSDENVKIMNVDFTGGKITIDNPQVLIDHLNERGWFNYNPQAYKDYISNIFDGIITEYLSKK